MSGVIILGDPHLGAGTNIGKITAGQHFNSRIVDQFKLLDWVFEQADREVVSDIIITGDLFEETKPDQNLIAEFLNWAQVCGVHNINVHVIMGNHDLERIGGHYKSALDIIRSVNINTLFIYKDIETIYVRNVAYTLVPYRDRKSLNSSSNLDAMNKLLVSLQYESAMIPKHCTKVVVGHLAIEGSIPVGNEIDDVTNELFFKPSDFSAFDYVWMGHIHKPQVMNKTSPYVAHIGSMDISNFGETEQSKYIVLFDNSLPNKFDMIKLPTRRLQKLKVTVPDGTEDSTQYVLDVLENEKKITNSILKVEIELDGINLKSVNRLQIQKALNNKGAHNVAKITESKKANVIKKNIDHSIDTTIDVESAIDMYSDLYIDELDKDGFKKLAKSLYMEMKK